MTEYKELTFWTSEIKTHPHDQPEQLHNPLALWRTPLARCVYRENG